MAPVHPPARPTVRAELERADRLLLAGRPREARAVYERLADNARDAVLAARVALAAEQAGEHDDAARWARRALELDPGVAGARLCLGNALLATGRAAEAEEIFRAAVEAEPADVDALFRLAQCRLERDPRAAERLLLEVTRLAPEAADGHEYLGHARARAGDGAGAAEAFARAVELSPASAELRKHLGNALMALERYRDAEAAYREAARLAPGDARYWNNLGAALRFQDRPEEALGALQRALALEPETPLTLANAGNLLLESGQPGRARRLFREALAREPANLDHRLDLCRARIRCQELEEGERDARVVLFARPDCARAVECLASVHMLRGETERSLELYARALELNGTLAAPHYRLAREGRLDDPEPIERLLASTRSAEDRVQLHFALGHVYERRADYARAFEHFRRANDLKRIPFDPAIWRAAARGVRETFTRERIERLRDAPGLGAPVSPRPIFVVGMIRTGTTLVEQIVASHPGVHGAGERPTLQALLQRLPRREHAPRPYPWCVDELDPAAFARLRDDYLADVVRACPGARAFTDKTPTHFLHLGLIAALFPDAVVLHTRRDPRDACLSAYFLNFNDQNSPYAYDLDHLVAFHDDYQLLMAHWREHLPLDVLDVPYEELVADTAAWTARILEHCRLPFDERCLRFHESPRAVFTASTAQVRHPTHTRSIGKWRRYAPYLGDFPERLVRASR